MRRLRMRRILNVQVEERKDRDETVPKGKGSWRIVQKKKEGGRHRSEECNDVGGEYKCTRCGKRSKHAQNSDNDVAMNGW